MILFSVRIKYVGTYGYKMSQKIQIINVYERITRFLENVIIYT